MQYLLKEYFNIKGTGPYLTVKAGSIIISEVEKSVYHDCYMIVIGKKKSRSEVSQRSELQHR